MGVKAANAYFTPVIRSVKSGVKTAKYEEAFLLEMFGTILNDGLELYLISRRGI